MERSEFSCAKRARQLSLDQIREFVMVSDSDKEQYDTSGMEDEEMEPRPPSRKSHLAQAVSSSDFSASTSEDDDVVENVASQQPQSTQWTLPPYPRILSTNFAKFYSPSEHLVVDVVIVKFKGRVMLAWAGHEPRPFKAVGRPALASANISRLDTRHNKHWPGRNPTKRRCRVCSERDVTRMLRSKFVKCEVALCVDRACFTDYHTKDTLFGPSSVKIAETSTKM
jgi:hypothetical protein